MDSNGHIKRTNSNSYTASENVSPIISKKVSLLGELGSKRDSVYSSLSEVIKENYDPNSGLIHPKDKILTESDEEDDEGKSLLGGSYSYKQTYSYKASSNVVWSSLNLWNDMIGVAIVSVPFYVRQMGILMTVLIFVIVGIINFYTLNSLFFLARKYEKRTLPDLAGLGLGLPGYLMASIFIYFQFWRICRSTAIVRQKCSSSANLFFWKFFLV